MIRRTEHSGTGEDSINPLSFTSQVRALISIKSERHFGSGHL